MAIYAKPREIKLPKGKGAVGAPRAFISSEGCGITRPQKLHAQKRKTRGREGARITRHVEKITLPKEKRPVGAPRALIRFDFYFTPLSDYFRMIALYPFL